MMAIALAGLIAGLYIIYVLPLIFIGGPLGWLPFLVPAILLAVGLATGTRRT